MRTASFLPCCWATQGIESLNPDRSLIGVSPNNCLHFQLINKLKNAEKILFDSPIGISKFRTCHLAQCRWDMFVWFFFKSCICVALLQVKILSTSFCLWQSKFHSFFVTRFTDLHSNQSPSRCHSASLVPFGQSFWDYSQLRIISTGCNFSFTLTTKLHVYAVYLPDLITCLKGLVPKT